MSAALVSGRLVSTVLRGAWRDSSTSELTLSAKELEEVTPLLYGSGAAGLGWWRIRNTEWRGSSSGELMHQALRLQTLFARLHETKVQKVFRLMRAAGVEPILIKGWAIGRLYSQPGLRPCGDIDLFVRRGDYTTALQVLRSDEARDCWVDLHARIFELADRDPEDLYSRSELVRCGDDDVRVLRLEDHFALLAIHFLKHGGWRPLWLCDLGLLLESLSDDFDWDLCLGKDKRRANWILSAVGLAQILLDAQLDDERVLARARLTPEWLVRGVLKQWERPFASEQPPDCHRAPIRSYLYSPRGLLRDLARRWPNPILATVSVNGTFDSRPRLRYQLSNCFMRAARLVLPAS